MYYWLYFSSTWIKICFVPRSSSLYQPETEEEESATEGKPAENNSDKTYSVDEEVDEEEAEELENRNDNHDDNSDSEIGLGNLSAIMDQANEPSSISK